MLAVNGGKKTVPDGLVQRWPIVTSAERRAVQAVLDRGVLSDLDGPAVTGLEKAWAAYQGSKYVVAVSGGTASIHCALVGAGIEPGDEVITPAFSFSGTFQPIIAVGAKPVFVDVDPLTYNINPDKIEDAITDKTRAILPVHLHGLMCDMSKINRLADDHDLLVIEDAAQAHGSSFNGQKAGTIGNAGCFSLNVTKNLPAGEGGLLCTNDYALFKIASMFRIFGENPENAFDGLNGGYNSYIHGVNYAFQELPAAFALSQLERLDERNANGIRNAERLSTLLNDVPGVLPPHCPPGYVHTYHKYRARISPAKMGFGNVHPVEFRDKFLRAIRAEGVSATLWHTIPMPLFEMFNGQYTRDDFPASCNLLDSSIVICEESKHIAAQSVELMHYYARAIEKVALNAGRLF